MDERDEPLLEKIKDKLNDLAGLPPGRFADGEPKPSEDPGAPRGGLTADDTENLPPHAGTGFKPIP